MFIVFSQPSVLWIQSLFNGAPYYFTENVVNVTILSKFNSTFPHFVLITVISGLVWFGWWTVIKHFWYMWSTRTSYKISPDGIIWGLIWICWIFLLSPLLFITDSEKYCICHQMRYSTHSIKMIMSQASLARSFLCC